MSDTIDPKTSHKQNVEQHFKSLISLWNEFIVSADDSLRELPTDCDKWLKEVRKKKRVKCPLEGCSQSYSSVGGLKYHYKRCGIELKFVWKCKLCGYEAVKGNRLIIQHLWSDHKVIMIFNPIHSFEYFSGITATNIPRIGRNRGNITDNIFNNHFGCG